MGHSAMFRVPLECHVGSHGAIYHEHFTLRVPCKHTWRTRSPALHRWVPTHAHMGHLVTCGATMQAHLWHHVVVCGAPSSFHACALGAGGYVRCTS